MEQKYWPHPEDAVTIKEVAGNEEASVKHMPMEVSTIKEFGRAQLSSQDARW